MKKYGYITAFGHFALIEEKNIKPYKDAKHKQKAYCLTIKAIYDNNRIAYLSWHETLEDATRKLYEFEGVDIKNA